MKIVSFEAENIKRLKAVEIIPDENGNLVILSGKNSQGKTSILDSICYVLQGRKAIPDDPIRHGEKEAHIVLELEGDTPGSGLIVSRHFTEKGDYLKVSPREMDATLSSPQKILDKLIGALSFDPHSFMNMAKRQQLDLLLKLVELPIDISELADERKEHETQRRDAGRDLKTIEAQFEEMPEPDQETPDEEVSVTEISSRLIEAQKHAAKVEKAKDDFLEAEGKHEALGGEIYNLKKSLEEKLLLFDERREDLSSMKEVLQALSAITYDQPAIQAELDAVDETNKAVRAAKTYAKKHGELKKAKEHHQECNKAIDYVDKKKAEALAAAEMPIEGLSFNDDCVTYQGIELSELGGAEQLRVSVAMAMALNPELRVIRISDGSLLDSDSLKILDQAAKENDFQIWIEMVDESGELGIVIEDGRVAGAEIKGED